ncbi:EAL domain-containing protein [Bacillus salitolerans]|uniref:EAL domain-containing protein n=1 Tax=Bacillus salitolerans TaxID=1437434 RepID=A0ABW4LNK4_9BACI
MKRMKEILSADLKTIDSSQKVKSQIFEIIFNAVKDMVYIMRVDENLHFRYIYANVEAVKHARLSDANIGQTLQEVLEPNLASYLHNKYIEAVIHNKPLSFQDSFIIKQQEVFSESILTPIHDDEGICRYVVSVTRDITDSVQEKKRLEESQQRYRSLMDHNMDGVLSLNEVGIIQQANPSCYSILGYTERELKYLSMIDLIEPEYRCVVENALNSTISGHTNDTINCQLVHKSGDALFVQLKMIPIVIYGTITGGYCIIRDITDQVRNDEVMKFIAFHDHLTGLPNRSSLKEDIVQFVQDATYNKESFSLMYLDLDRFKFLNDTMGHNMGDLLLKEVATRLLSIEQNKGTVYRQGGDEFIFILQNTNRFETHDIAEQILDLFRTPFLLNSQEFFVTPSIGISMFPRDGSDGETLIKSADTALYRVKERGRGHFQFYSNDMRKGNSHIMLLETCLRKAIKKDELLLYYQPQVDLSTGKISSFEALLRWNCGLLGFVSPAEFIPLAEETGLILPIGEWVIEEVCRQQKEWHEKGYNEIAVAINLSARQFQQPNLVEVIKNSLHKNNVNPSILEIEITEGAMQDTRETIVILQRLKELGVQISVDDFGTGYSSLSYLKRFPLNTLKIDQSFVKDVLTDSKDAAIITSIIHLAQSLGFNVIAEGVELEEQAQFLLRKGCHKAQGFLFSRPLPANQIEEQYLLGKE